MTEGTAQMPETLPTPSCSTELARQTGLDLRNEPEGVPDGATSSTLRPRPQDSQRTKARNGKH